MRRARTYRSQTASLIRLLGLEIARVRRERRWTVAELAERAATSVPTVRRIERGDPTVAIGTVFEVATLAGLQLFGADRSELPGLIDRSRDRLALLPAKVREPSQPVHDDF
jgi:transcriptional regulator with XRE-family HTH domain